jgi:hypothetical protein
MVTHNNQVFDCLIPMIIKTGYLLVLYLWLWTLIPDLIPGGDFGAIFNTHITLVQNSNQCCVIIDFLEDPPVLVALDWNSRLIAGYSLVSLQFLVFLFFQKSWFCFTNKRNQESSSSTKKGRKSRVLKPILKIKSGSDLALTNQDQNWWF